MSPDTPYDGKGVFTGCMLPATTNEAGNVLTCVYTSVSSLPIHYTIPHPKGCESLSLAKSVDGGKTWEKYVGNPILPSEPAGLDVSGWRDPYVSLWPNMAEFLDLPAESTLFGIISGGIREVTPTSFLYSIAVSDITKWQYLGPLVDLSRQNIEPLSSRWSGDFGNNWEVTNFMTLKDEKDSSIERNFLVMGVEGRFGTSPSSYLGSEASPTAAVTGPSRPIRAQLWMAGTLIKPEQHQSKAELSSPVQMQCNWSGYLDYGSFYAANSFWDPKSSKRIFWGWVTEDDLCDELRNTQGWSGMLSLPREICLQTVENVVYAWSSELRTITSIECEQKASGATTIRTIATEPVQSVVEILRHSAKIRQAKSSSYGLLSCFEARDLHFTSDDVQSTAWELGCSFRVSTRCRKIGVQIIHSKGDQAIL